MARFNIGDRVIGIAVESGVDIAGMTGTVVIGGSGDCGVEFDEYNQKFHSCGGRAKEGYGWYCQSNVLDFLTEEITMPDVGLDAIFE